MGVCKVLGKRTSLVRATGEIRYEIVASENRAFSDMCDDSEFVVVC